MVNRKKQVFIKIITNEGVVCKPLTNVKKKDKKGMLVSDILKFAKENNAIVRILFQK